MVGVKVGSHEKVKDFFVAVCHKTIWEASRAARIFRRRFGLFGYGLIASLLVSVGAYLFERHLAAVEVRDLAYSAEQKKIQIRSYESHQPDVRAGMIAFQDHLLPHDEIPDVVQDLLELAKAEKLWIARGEYRPLVDLQGEFLRYRMTLPVKGDAQAIYRFMQAALRSQKALALESVQFKREKIQSQDIDARIQWIVLTRLPSLDVKKTVVKGE